MNAPQQNSRELYFRFTRNAHRNLPLTVRSVGYYQLYNFCTIDAKPVTKWFSQIFWTIQGRGEVTLGDKTVRTGPGEIFVHWPGEQHFLRHPGTSWVYRW